MTVGSNSYLSCMPRLISKLSVLTNLNKRALLARAKEKLDTKIIALIVESNTRTRAEYFV